MRSGLFPSSFPSELADAAFTSGGEAAWPPALAAEAVGWFGEHEYAVLGSELWLLKEGTIQSLPVGASGMRELHGNTISRQSGEAWSSFVGRAGLETRTYLQSFNPSDITEEGQVYFNL